MKMVIRKYNQIENMAFKNGIEFGKQETLTQVEKIIDELKVYGSGDWGGGNVVIVDKFKQRLKELEKNTQNKSNAKGSGK